MSNPLIRSLRIHYGSFKLKGSIQIEKENKHSLKALFESLAYTKKIRGSYSNFLLALLRKSVKSLKLSFLSIITPRSFSELEFLTEQSDT